MSHVKGFKIIKTNAILSLKFVKWLGQNSHVDQGSHRNKGFKIFENLRTGTEIKLKRIV